MHAIDGNVAGYKRPDDAANPQAEYCENTGILVLLRSKTKLIRMFAGRVYRCCRDGGGPGPFLRR
jgi:hypothetical protein